MHWYAKPSGIIGYLLLKHRKKIYEAMMMKCTQKALKRRFMTFVCGGILKYVVVWGN